MKYIKLLLLSFLLPIYAANGQIANFTADTSEGCAPLIVHFTNTSTGATHYAWDLGNGVTSPLRNPSTSYIVAGTYTVTLTAYNGGSSNVKRMIIIIDSTPAVSFTVNDTTVCPGIPVTFTNTSRGRTSGPITSLWNFGDGTSSPVTSPAHAFSTPGYFNVTLSVTNGKGCKSIYTRPAYVYVYTPAKPDFTVNSQYFCDIPGHAIFINGTTGTPVVSYKWRFGDGDTSTAINPVHNYTAVGTYHVTLRTTDSNYCTDSLRRLSYISAGTLIARYTGVDTTCVNAPVKFTNTSTTYTSSKWLFGDGDSTFTDTTAWHSYKDTGRYTVTLVVYDGMCYDTFSRKIVIVTGPKVTITRSPINPCPANSNITYSTIPAAATTTWSFDDGTTKTGSPVTHNYTDNGLHIVTMTAANKWGCSTNAADTVLQRDLFTRISVDSSGGCIPHTTGFRVKPYTYLPDSLRRPRNYPFGIASYTWKFGDGSPSTTDATPTHTYTAVGNYKATATIITGNGCTVTDSVTISVGIPTVATYSVAPAHVCTDVPILFTVTNPGTATLYIWEWGAGLFDTTSQITFSHPFPVPGTFAATMIPYHNGCRGTPYTSSTTVLIDSPMARFHAYFPCTPPLTNISFNNLALGSDSHLWMFGDGTTSAAANPTHNYPAISNYVARLATYNRASGCRDTVAMDIEIVDLKTDISADDSTICKGESVVFSPIVSGGAVHRNIWIVDGTFIFDSAWYMHTFNYGGFYTVELRTMNQHNCWNTVTKTNFITVGNPIAKFSAPNPGGCVPATYNFTDRSTDLSGLTFTNYEWTFGDGTAVSSSSPTVSYTYYASGMYDVQEIVTDNIGCKDTLAKTSFVNVSNPDALFTTSTRHVCFGDSVHFTRLYPGMIGSTWFFGDGTSSTLASPSHYYATKGNYTITHIVTDLSGCADTVQFINYLTVTRPKASFTMSDTFAVCPPLSVNFTNTSIDAATYKWNFGDSNTSVASSPTNVYTFPGYFKARLVTIDTNGCTDTASAHALVFGIKGTFTYAPIAGCAPLRVNFTSGHTNAVSIVWDYADGVTSTPSLALTASHVYSLSGTYLPKLVLTDSNGCQTATPGIDSIKVEMINTGFIMEPDHLCKDSLFGCLDTSGSYMSTITSRLWTFNGDTSSSISPWFIADTEGTFLVTLRLTDDWGCMGTASKLLHVYGMPYAGTITGDAGLCKGATITLSDSVQGGTWTSLLTGYTTLTPGIAGTINVQGNIPGTDVIMYVVGNGYCADTASKEITVYALPYTGSIECPPKMCKEAEITLTNAASGGIWSSGTPSIATVNPVSGILNSLSTGTTVITYTVGPDANGCVNSITDTINIIPKATYTIDSAVTQVRCYGIDSGSIAIIVNDALPPLTYQWSNSETTPSIYNLAPGQYILKITEVKTQCRTTSEFTITWPDSVALKSEVTNDICEKSAGSIRIDVTGGVPPYIYSWANNGTGTELAGLRSGNYPVSITDMNGCTRQFSVVVKDDTCFNMIPDVITPNGDGINDYWVIPGLDKYPGNIVQIFNKLGDLLYEKANYFNDWSGIGKNGELPDGTYFYVVRLNAENMTGGKNAFTGSIMIKR